MMGYGAATSEHGLSNNLNSPELVNINCNCSREAQIQKFEILGEIRDW